MAVEYGTRIVSPPELDDLRQVLGDPHLRLEDLGVSPNINPFAKHKFVRYAKLDDLTEQELRDTNYGLRFHTAFAPDQLEQGFEYLRPDGANWHFRLDDMIGYDHTSSAPMRGYGDIELRLIGGGSHTFWFMGRLPSIYDLTLADFPALENFYPCLVISTPKGLLQWKTAENKFGEEGDKAITVTYDELNKFVDKGPYTYLLCGFSTKQTSFSAMQQFGQFTSLPSDEDLTGKITISNRVNIDVEFLYIKDNIQLGENTFEDINKYAGLLSIDGSRNWRYGVGNSGNIALVARITNNENAISIARAALEFNVFPTIVEHQNEVIAKPSRTFLMTMNGLTGQAEAINSNIYISFKPGETKYIGWNLPNIALTTSTGNVAFPTDSMKADMIVALQYKTGAGKTTLGSVAGPLRVKSGMTDTDDPILGPIISEP